MPVAATFDFRDEVGESLSDVARLDAMVTVVDAINLPRDFASHDFLTDRGESLGEGDERTLVNLLTDQIEFAKAAREGLARAEAKTLAREAARVWGRAYPTGQGDLAKRR
jgi:hypothetical protein